jgi:hypothetical protein
MCYDQVAMTEPLDPTEARRLIREIVTNQSGTLVFTGHARDEMAKDDLDEVDCTRALRGGVVEPAEWENGRWRYRVHSFRVWVVVQFISEQALLVVTAWRTN